MFGEVLSGQDVIKRIEEESGSADGDPQKPVTITDCGVVDIAAVAPAEETVAEEMPTGAAA